MKKKTFNLYMDIKEKLVRRGIPPNEIAFIHDAKTPEARERLFAAVRSGQVRVLIGSTAKMGTGMNVQERLLAMHHLDAPWRPADVEQREGRILRQGNRFKEAFEFVYITKESFDAYIWQILETKARFIDQVMSGQINAREIDDISKTALSMAEIKALASGDPEIMQMIAVENELSKLDSVRSAWLRNRQLMQLKLNSYRQQEAGVRGQITDLEEALRIRNAHARDDFSMKVLGQTYFKRKEAGAALNRAFLQYGREAGVVGSFQGFTLRAQLIGRLIDATEMNIRLEYGEGKSLRAKVGESGLGTIQSIEAILRGLEAALERLEKFAAGHIADIAAIEEGLKQGWEEAERYTSLKEDLAVLKPRVLRDDDPDEKARTVALSDQAEVAEQAQADAPHILRPRDGELEIAHILEAVQAAEKTAFPNIEEEAIVLDPIRLEKEAANASALAAFSRAALTGTGQQVSFADWLGAHDLNTKVKRKEVRKSIPQDAAQLTFF
jgi:superfamily II DNA/RNA helicase